MFTGIIQSVGHVTKQGNSLQIIGCGPFLPLNLGDSVSVDGVCLTVTNCVQDGFIADISEETLERTTLGEKAEANGYVNLEPAMKLNDRLGGHLVSGHVDGMGSISSITSLKNSWNIEVKWNNGDYGRFISEKASISLNGISLTVANFSENGKRFSIAVIPHTWENTSLKHLVIGSSVNLEADLMAKYAERLLFKNESSFEINKDWLLANGW
tara:strand:- start:115 stop:750 length:636 start_codon:yes stop_codon:yes gene_type:complete